MRIGTNEFVATPELMIEKILNRTEEIYCIKVKCLGCTEGAFLSYVKPFMNDGKLSIGEVSYPIKLIEQIRIRYYYIDRFKMEDCYKVSSEYFRKFFNEEAIELLENFEKSSR